LRPQADWQNGETMKQIKASKTDKDVEQTHRYIDRHADSYADRYNIN